MCHANQSAICAMLGAAMSCPLLPGHANECVRALTCLHTVQQFPRAVLLATGPQAVPSDIYAQIRSPQHVMPAVLPTRYALKRLVCFMHTICIISLAQLCAMVVRFTGFPFKRPFGVPTASLPIAAFRYGGSALLPASTATAIMANHDKPCMCYFRTVDAVAFRA